MQRYNMCMIVYDTNWKYAKQDITVYVLKTKENDHIHSVVHDAYNEQEVTFLSTEIIGWKVGFFTLVNL